MSLADTLIMELDQEAKATRAILARVPDDKLAWKPHVKSMSLGYLAQHIATMPGGAAQMGSLDTVDFATFSPPPEPESAAAIVATFEAGVAQAKAILAGMDEATLLKNWSVTRDGRCIMSLPRIGFYRSVLFNHLYHHRGQLSVYLRLLDIPVPSIYGPSADENPFG